jgi:hypothetical protein
MVIVEARSESGKQSYAPLAEFSLSKDGLLSMTIQHVIK